MEIKMKLSTQTQSILNKAEKRFKCIHSKVLEIKQEIDKTDKFIRENINTVENYIIPNIEGLDNALAELEGSRNEIYINLEEVDQAIEELEIKIEDVYSEQNHKLNPNIIQTLNGQISMEECEKELEHMSDKIKSLEDEIRGK